MAYPALNIVTNMLFAAARLHPNRTDCMVSGRFVSSGEKVTYRQGDGTHGCEVVLHMPPAKAPGDVTFTSIRIKNADASHECDDLKVIYLTKMLGGDGQKGSLSAGDTVDVKLTRTIRKVSYLGLEDLQAALIDGFATPFDIQDPMRDLVKLMFK